MGEPFVREQKKRREKEGIFSYEFDHRITLTSLTGRPVPEQLKPQIDTIFREISDELDDKIAAVFNHYEDEPSG